MGFFDKLKAGLRRTKNALFGTVEQILRAFVKIDEDLFEELEEALIMADVGVDTTMYILDELRERIKEKRLTDPMAAQDEV